MERRFGLGLRAQIILALTAAFIASFTLLGIVSVQLSQRARTLDRTQAAEATARVMAAAIDPEGDKREQSDALLESVLGHGGIFGGEVQWPGIHEAHARGYVGVGQSVEAPFADSGTVRLWIRRPTEADSAPFTNLLLLYVAVTGGGILLLAYVALTYLIVRPVSALTLASERIAGGSRNLEVPVGGAAEIARLATSFNSMTSQLRSERKALEDRLVELTRTTEELESAQDQVVRGEKLASVGRLAAGVAHEIGNPLAAILGLVELLRDDDLEEGDRGEFLRRIQGETERINKIIRDLLDFSRLDQDGGEEASTSLVEVVEDATSLITPQKDLRNVIIERRLEEDAPRVRGSADRLGQIVLNLLLNAADAIEGDGTIQVDVFGEKDGKHVTLSVTDTGPGIAENVLEHLFEPFVTTKATGQGTGLGLAVCHTIVERLGGSITAENVPEGGARITVRLPTG